MTWRTPQYPGDTVRILDVRKDAEVGSIRIQAYGNPSNPTFKVGTFLPGEIECAPGDTPKVWPEEFEWTKSVEIADQIFDAYTEKAFADGWKEVQ
jgi:hypothetical protein